MIFPAPTNAAGAPLAPPDHREHRPRVRLSSAHSAFGVFPSISTILGSPKTRPRRRTPPHSDVSHTPAHRPSPRFRVVPLATRLDSAAPRRIERIYTSPSVSPRTPRALRAGRVSPLAFGTPRASSRRISSVKSLFCLDALPSTVFTPARHRVRDCNFTFYILHVIYSNYM